MKNLILLFLLPALIGTGIAWTINHNRYGYRDAKFGELTLDDTVSVTNLEEYVNINGRLVNGIGRIKLLTDPVFDFGVMAPGKEGQHVFRIQNVGDGLLRLKVGASTCKCTLGELSKAVLEPNEETEITLTWTPQVGKPLFKQKAQVISNDPETPAISLKITGKVVSDFEMSPMVWSFGEVASGEPFKISGEIYNFSSHKIKPTTVTFSGDSLNSHAEIDVQEIPVEEFGEGRADAIEGFRIVAKIKSGMDQGVITQNLLFNYQRGERIKPESEEEKNKLINTKLDGEDWQLPVLVKGRIVGALRMIESSKLKARASGGYLLRMGKIHPNDKLTAKCFLMLKGADRETTKLSIGKLSPEGTLKASLGERKSRGKMVLYPLTVELVPGKKTVERLGKNKEDFGEVTILSDNPKVGNMVVAITFSLDSR